MTKRKASVALDTGNESNQSSSTQDNNSNSTSATNTTTGTSTNHGNQNGTSAARSNGGEQQLAGDRNGGCNQQKSKKERADNWSTAEIQVLHRGIETRREIFYGPPSQATKKNREIAWESITKEVNSVSTTPRSLSQVMKKFKNEKCRAKRKFIDNDKDGHNNLSNSNSTNSVNNNSIATTTNTNMSAQNHTTNTNTNQQLQSQQQQPQPHHMTTTQSSMTSQPSAINVVKLAPQNVAKTMIDLPGHVQQIQMPNDDNMVLIVPPDMDGLLSGMNIVSDGNNHHFQKCSGNSTLNNQQHNHHGQHAVQAINTGQGLLNGSMGNSMITRAIPAGNVCSLVYSTGGDVCATEQHITNSVAGPNSLGTNHISVNAQNLVHHRGSVEQSQGQQQQQQQQQQPQHQHHHLQLHQHQQLTQQQSHQQQQQQQQQPSHQHQTHQSAPHNQHHLQQNQLATTTTTQNSGGVGGGGAVESQLKNLLFNLLLKDGQHSMPATNSNQDYNKQRNDMLAIIASSLNKIEGHLSKISKVANTFFSQNLNNSSNDASSISTSSSLNNQNNSLNINNNDSNNNNLSITGTGSTNTISNQSETEA